MPAGSGTLTSHSPGERGNAFTLPRTREAWIAVILGVFALSWGLFFQDLVHPPIPGGAFIPSAVATVVAFALGLSAMIRQGERSWLLWLSVILTGLFSLFAVLFVALELLVGHN